MEPRTYFFQQARCDLLFGAIRLPVVEPFREILDRHLCQVRNSLAVDSYIKSFGTQPASVAFGADGASAVSRHHDAVLNLILVFFNHFEETVDSREVGAVTAVPEKVELVGGKILIGLVDWEFCA